jgi:hypothetical protein
MVFGINSRVHCAIKLRRGTRQKWRSFWIGIPRRAIKAVFDVTGKM